jgi:4-amino-4-deoxy-L-arabinose transferase-like glycosyltransferase
MAAEGKRTAFQVLSLLMLASLAVRIIFVVGFLDSTQDPWEDARHYHTAAVSLLADGTFGADAEVGRPGVPYGLEPVYPLVLAGLMAVFGGSFLPIRLAQSILLTLSVIPLYLAIRRHVPERWALVAGGAYLFYPFYVFFSGMIMPESLFLLLFVLYFWLTTVFLEGAGRGHLLASVALLAVMGHLKVSSWSLGLVTAGVFFLRYRVTDRKFWSNALLCAVVFLAICLPWAVRNYEVQGHLTLPRNRSGGDTDGEVAQQLEARFTVPENVGLLFSPGLTRVDSKNQFNRAELEWLSIAVVMPLLAATLLLPLLLRTRFVALLYAILFSYSLPYLLLRAQTRYRLPADFVMLVCLALAAAWAEARLKARRGSDPGGGSPGRCTGTVCRRDGEGRP